MVKNDLITSTASVIQQTEEFEFPDKCIFANNLIITNLRLIFQVFQLKYNHMNFVFKVSQKLFWGQYFSKQSQKYIDQIVHKVQKKVSF